MPHPLKHSLHHQVGVLRKALKATRSAPDPEPLHHLRSTMRRIQALLQLLADPSPAAYFLKSTKSLRRSSGALRDLDIQIELLTQIPSTPIFKPFIEDLTRRLKKRRRVQATKFQHQLDKNHEKTLSKLKELESAHPITQPTRLARKLFTQTTATLNPNIPNDLHTIRKAARISRYLAEATPQGANSPTAHYFHQIHQTTGKWHDLLILTESATNTPLTQTLENLTTEAHKAALKLLKTKA